MSHETRDYLDAALAIIEAHALKRAVLDWESTRRETFAQVAALTAIPAVYPIIRDVLRRLGDHHSFFRAPDAVQREENGEAYQVGLLADHPTGVVIQVLPGSAAAGAGIHIGDAITTIDAIPVATLDADAFYGSMQAEVVMLAIEHSDGDSRVLTLHATSFARLPEPTGHVISSAIGYVEVPAMEGVAAQAQPYATQMQDIIRACDQQDVTGWIVDLRRNTGGNMWPMLAGLGPLLGDSDLGAFAYPDGATEPWTYQSGKAALDGWTMVQVEEPYTLRSPDVPIALLTSPHTASSGELTALALHARPHIRSFGEPTRGVPTANALFALGDGAVILLTVAFGADHTGQTFDGPLMPDHPIATDWRLFGTAGDLVVQAAMAWLTGSAPA